jgi:hypothetical protein
MAEAINHSLMKPRHTIAVAWLARYQAENVTEQYLKVLGVA